MNTQHSKGGTFLITVLISTAMAVGLLGVYLARHGDGTVGRTLVTAILGYLGVIVLLSGCTLVVMAIATPYVPRHPNWWQLLRYRLWMWL